MIESVEIELADFVEDFGISSETIYVDIIVEIDWDTVAEKILDMYTGGFDIDEIIYRLSKIENEFVTLSTQI